MKKPLQHPYETRPVTCTDCAACPKRFCIVACGPVNDQLSSVDDELRKEGH